MGLEEHYPSPPGSVIHTFLTPTPSASYLLAVAPTVFPSCPSLLIPYPGVPLFPLPKATLLPFLIQFFPEYWKLPRTGQELGLVAQVFKECPTPDHGISILKSCTVFET